MLFGGHAFLGRSFSSQWRMLRGRAAGSSDRDEHFRERERPLWAGETLSFQVTGQSHHHKEKDGASPHKVLESLCRSRIPPTSGEKRGHRESLAQSLPFSGIEPGEGNLKRSHYLLADL